MTRPSPYAAAVVAMLRQSSDGDVAYIFGATVGILAERRGMTDSDFCEEAARNLEPAYSNLRRAKP